ncbi:MAG: YdjY domain-containing protein, partial [Verrucomicrobiota bacterium]
MPAVPAFIERPAGPVGPPLTNLMALAASQVTRDGEGRYRLGLVTLDARERTLSFPAEVNLREGQLEYAIVTRGGKLHESLLATDVRPLHVHLAALLLGLAPTNRAAPPLPLSIEVEWKGNGPPRRVPLESLVGLAGGDARRAVVSPLSQRTWDYSGSGILQGSLEADLEGSLVALISDPSALARLPLPPGMVARRDQQFFVPQASRMP